MQNIDYQPFGEEWQADMMRWSKRDLVARIAAISRESLRLEKNGKNDYFFKRFDSADELDWFIIAVEQMRNAQKSYFADRSEENARAIKNAQTVVDEKLSKIPIIHAVHF